MSFSFPEKIWPSFLSVVPVSLFLKGMIEAKQSFLKLSWSKRIFYILLSPVFLILSIVRATLESCFDLIFHVLHCVFILLFLWCKGIFLILKSILALPLAFVFYVFEIFYKTLDFIIYRLLLLSLSHWALLLVGIAFLLGYCILEVTPRLGKELIPEIHQGEFHLEITYPIGTTVEKSDQKLKKIEEFLLTQKKIAKISTVVGSDKLSSNKEEQGEHTARITITLPQEKNRIEEEEKLIHSIRQELQGYPGMEWKVSRPVLFSFKTPIEVEIHGYNLQKLHEIARKAQEKIALIPGIYDVKSNIGRGNPEIQIIYNRSLMAHYKLNLMDVANLVRSKVKGDVATRFKEKDRRVDILIRLTPEDRESIQHLKRLVVNPGGSKPISLSSVADIVLNEGPSEIRRINQHRTAIITANISGKDLQSANNDIYHTLESMDMPQDFSFTLSGQNKEMQTSLSSLQLALFLAMFLVYIVMASQFESLLQPMIIMFTVPLAFIGVVLTLDFFKIPLNIMVFLGMIVLAGIVVNNAIVLVDYINQLRNRGINKKEAILKASHARLRPILMTTATTVLGLLPMVVGLGDASEMRIPMAITVISGLSSSTILTLVVIPTIYSLVQKD
ncbi:MAG: efflux RND transporter permease subunit [Candidatus Brocadiae bacterium]|nr:efflux RND transporter permease subunit [Candidatus Brocadiia bacterium]